MRYEEHLKAETRKRLVLCAIGANDVEIKSSSEEFDEAINTAWLGNYYPLMELLNPSNGEATLERWARSAEEDLVHCLDAVESAIEDVLIAKR